MVRTRGASYTSREESSRGESSAQGEARRRPTASARRRRAAPIHDDPIAKDRAFEEEAYQAYGGDVQEEAYEGDVQEEAFQAPDHDDDEEEHADVGDIEEDIGGFPGGPRDASLLTHYVQHVAYGISQGRDRGDMLKLISHGKKVNKLGPRAEGIQHIVLNSSLMPLIEICYDYGDKGLLLGFIERWHFETSSFLLPVGVMSITLDDVSTLLHLPVMGQLCGLEELEFEEARSALVDLLGVDGGTAGAEMEDGRGPKVRLSWLREIYGQRCQSQHWDYAARAYLLHLVGCTIFANNSATSIRVSYLLLFRDVHACDRYAWGVAALAHLYEQLGDASMASTRQMAGYLTLFQVHTYTLHIYFRIEFVFPIFPPSFTSKYDESFSSPHTSSYVDLTITTTNPKS
ncbi:Protein MAIN-LIKE 1 [Vigna angularis]|uniref:Protein MAIN-LIKE 1 n=1 Tax=Phaseolus angularis TaxID=3914 RepID=A0A8T0JZH6_PHAAN|nr:protein MAIN-LIKE 1-like [Vigna angularis]KAG2390276.1 Protein MAIN-LIKE 1 [Vigna angularis]